MHASRLAATSWTVGSQNTAGPYILSKSAYFTNTVEHLFHLKSFHLPGKGLLGDTKHVSCAVRVWESVADRREQAQVASNRL